MEKTTVYLTPELRRALKEAAKVQKQPEAVLIRQALEEYLSRRENPPLRSLGLGEDRDLSAADSEDWLATEWGRD